DISANASRHQPGDREIQHIAQQQTDGQRDEQRAAESQREHERETGEDPNANRQRANTTAHAWSLARGTAFRYRRTVERGMQSHSSPPSIRMPPSPGPDATSRGTIGNYLLRSSIPL